MYLKIAKIEEQVKKLLMYMSAVFKVKLVFLSNPLKIKPFFPVEGTVPQGTIRDQRQWSIQECADVFAKSLDTLKTDLNKQGDGGMLVWDKVIDHCCLLFPIADIISRQCDLGIENRIVDLDARGFENYEKQGSVIFTYFHTV